MNARVTAARRELRTRSHNTRAAARAARRIATGTPQPAAVRLVHVGIDPATAKRYVGAFSNGVTPTQLDQTVIKLRGRRTKTVPVKLYDQDTFRARLAEYRPKDPAAAAKFEAAAHRLAA